MIKKMVMIVELFFGLKQILRILLGRLNHMQNNIRMWEVVSRSSPSLSIVVTNKL